MGSAFQAKITNWEACSLKWLAIPKFYLIGGGVRGQAIFLEIRYRNVIEKVLHHKVVNTIEFLKILLF